MKSPISVRPLSDAEQKAVEAGLRCGRWTRLSQVSSEQGLSRQVVTAETIRAPLERFGMRWKRAKRWITRPDPEDLRKKARATA